jgi:hypothetical protein
MEYLWVSKEISYYLPKCLHNISSGAAFRAISGKLYPAVGVRSRGAHIRANFGQEPFLFDATEA